MKLKLITANLRYDKPDPGNSNWQVRREAVAGWISQEQPDILGTQECLAHQMLDLHRRLPEYQSIGCDRQGNGGGEYCGIFYHPQRLTCLESGEFWLSETPDIPGSISPEWGNHQSRFVTWGKFISAENQQIIVLNTHLDYNSALARDLGAKLILNQLNQWPDQQSYRVLMGDFNASPQSQLRQMLAQGSSFDRPWLDALAEVPLEEQNTYHEFTGKAWDAVDTIYYDARCSLLSARVERSPWEGVLISDHFPVVAQVLLR
ncbi:endonuclease/exonuclease/phosphatase family protein [Roseofilum reptotaenium CS-1145]|uniref:Endonuclease/exonuclease/phosphatase n=1 Tax=Roseofilum reptotaenium AO1-A TaxID=1925591 RepID=A0A1L9QMR4_9CYAN|nr:endonuclease/exonuclease/phosphatase family protein [Roseofilum reptotaenium]MDB9515687.1 endonuclease/exonuclease/phosphatase family protein [Roseofilum reptotaenium CS-1145]OJJ22736.1 endonuclease/exonuclease/phosphatase [Roseofilum reptotaenium AO1-A]